MLLLRVQEPTVLGVLLQYRPAPHEREHHADTSRVHGEAEGERGREIELRDTVHRQGVASVVTIVVTVFLTLIAAVDLYNLWRAKRAVARMRGEDDKMLAAASLLVLMGRLGIKSAR